MQKRYSFVAKTHSFLLQDYSGALNNLNRKSQIHGRATTAVAPFRKKRATTRATARVALQLLRDNLYCIFIIFEMQVHKINTGRTCRKIKIVFYLLFHFSKILHQNYFPLHIGNLE